MPRTSGGDKIIRIVALIGLCALVYYFSFEQGRSSQDDRSEHQREVLKAKDRVIQSLALEIKQLKDRLVELEQSGCPEAGAEAEAPGEGRVTIRLNASRIMFDGALVLTCLDIDRTRRMARLQVNLVREDRLVTEGVGLGKSLKFSLQNKAYTLILEQLHSSFVLVKLLAG